MRVEGIKRGVLQSGVGQHTEVILRYEGAERCYDLRVDPAFSPNGEICGITCAAIDVTQRKQIERSLVNADLRKNEFLAILAYDGEQAIEAWQSYLPDVTLLDIGLPNLNGYEVCRLIRKLEGGSTTVLVAQTGWGQDEDRRRTADAGFDHHLVKPLDPSTLMQLLRPLTKPPPS